MQLRLLSSNIKANFKLWLFLLVVIVAAGLRIYHLDQLPPSLYWEETALGYDAYSIATTGHDHHGHPFPIVAFESFGDWKPSGYFYAIVPFIPVFGLSAWSVRLPAAIAGIATVVGVWQLANLWLRMSYRQSVTLRREQQVIPNFWQWLPLTAAAVAAISPWMIIFSRAGWEVNLATSLTLWGVIAGLSAITNSPSKQGLQVISEWVGCVILLIAAMYTYHSCRVISPLLGLGLIGSWWYQSGNVTRFLKQQAALLIGLLVLATVLLLPFIRAFGTPQLSQRFAETSIFSDTSVIEESNARVATSALPWLDKLLYHRYVLFGREILHNYLTHFSLHFLFVSGDVNARHSIQYMGQLYHIEAIFLLVGLYFWFKQWKPVSWLLCFWLLIGILPAALTNAVPHALRILPVTPVVMLLIGMGIIGTVQLVAEFWHGLGVYRKWLPWLSVSLITHVTVALIIGAYLIEFTMFWRFYTLIYPKLYSQDWQYGYAQLVPKLQSLESQYPNLPIFVTREMGRPAMNYWFYTKTDPREVQAADATAQKDQGEFLNFKSITFVRGIGEIHSQPEIVAAPAESFDQLQHNGFQFAIVETVTDLRQQPVWKIGVIKQ